MSPPETNMQGARLPGTAPFFALPALAALLWLAVAAPVFGSGSDAALDPGATVGDLLEAGRASPGGQGTAEETSPFILFLRFSASVAVALALFFGALLLYRRWTPWPRRLRASGWVQVLGSAPLTPRHTIYVVRLGKRLLAVGVSGDRMTPLSEIARSDGEDMVSGLASMDSSGAGGRAQEEVPPDALQAAAEAASAKEERLTGRRWHSRIRNWSRTISGASAAGD